MSEEKKAPKIAGLKSIPLEMKIGTYSYCTCGESLNQPFCDGSHNGTGYQPLEFSIFEEKKFGFCACKRSCKAPYCDGEHKKYQE